MNKALITGFGCAGYHAVKAMREAGFGGEIHVFTDSAAAPANPMLTTYSAAGKIPPAAMQPFGGIDELEEKFALTVHREKITAVDYDGQCAHADDGSVHSWDKLLIATGARALIPPFPGHDLEGVLAMRTPEDSHALTEWLDRGGVRRAVVVGASMVGIKVLELLYNRGIEVTLADMAPGIFPLAAIPEYSERILSRVKRDGIEYLLGKGITAIERTPAGLCAVFGEDSRLDCDLVVLCIGTRAATELAGDRLPLGRGIIVDERMKTGLDNVYAAGDCCEGNNLLSGETQIIGLWANAAAQGRTAGINMAGGDARFEGNITHNITHFFDMDFISFGDIRIKGERLHYEAPDGSFSITAILSGGRLVCINALDAFQASGVLKALFLRRLSDPDAVFTAGERARLGRSGIPAWFADSLEGGAGKEGLYK